jgi:predicted HTH domain antitoxin
MPLTVEVPDALVAAVDLSPEELVVKAKAEMLLGLYQLGHLSAGKAAQLMGISRMDFEDLLCRRQVVRPFSLDDLEHDLRVVDEMIIERGSRKEADVFVSAT